MLILPELCPDETIYSLLARIARMNGISHLALVGQLMGEEHPITVMGCPVNLKHFCDFTHNVYGTPHEVLHRLTLLTLAAHLGDLSASMLTGIENGTWKPKLATFAWGVQKGFEWRICKACVARDIEVFGTAYWHRLHQLPISKYCTEHGLLLEKLDLRRIRDDGRCFTSRSESRHRRLRVTSVDSRLLAQTQSKRKRI